MKKLLLTVTVAVVAWAGLGWVGRSAPVHTVTIGPDQNLHQVVRDVPLGAEAKITLLPGLYNKGVSNLWYNPRVSFHFMGCELEYMGNVRDHGAGMFDDRHTRGGGAVTSTITGSLTIRYCAGTNVHWDEVCTPTGHTNALGAIVVTNANSLIQWNAETRIGTYGPPPAVSAIYVRNCQSNTVFRTFEFFNAHPNGTNQITVTNCPADPGSEYLVNTGSFPVYWELGTFHLYFTRMPALGTLAVGAYGVTNTDSASMFLHGDWMDGKIYAVGKSKNWKIWTDVLEWVHTDTALDNAFNAYGAGSHYIRAQKMSSANGASILLQTPGVGPDTNLTVWVDIDKVSGSNGFARVTHGQLRGRIGQFEQNGPNDGTPGIDVTNVSALVSLQGENAAYANTFLRHGGGQTELRGYNIQTTNHDPILALGGGLTLKGITAATTSGTNSIRAETAQIVNADGLGSRPQAARLPHTNVTLLTAQARVLERAVAPVVNAGTAATNLQVTHIPAHLLTNNGDTIRISASGRYSGITAGANSNSLIFGSTTLLNTGAQASSNCAFRIEAEITRTASTAQAVKAALFWGGAGTPYASTNAVLQTAETNGISTALRLVTHQPNNGGLTNLEWSVEYIPAQ